MSRLIISTQMTVDGVIEPGDWFIQHGDQERKGLDQLDEVEAVVLGRPTYQGLAEYWSPISGDEWADRINPKPKFVGSRTLEEPLEWNATLIKGDVADGVAALKAELRGDLLMYGCGTLARHLVAQDLVDEVRFWVHPVVWGPGKRPFHEGPAVQLQRVASTSFESGVTLLCYRPAKH